MAALLSSRCPTASILHLPPSVRTSLFANAAARRSFSSTPQRRTDYSNLTQLAIAAPTAVLDAVHAVGIPWCTAIPITAIFVRGVVAYYLAVRPSRRRQDRRMLLHPLTNARVQAQVQQTRLARLHKWREEKRTPSAEYQDTFFKLDAMWYKARETIAVGSIFGAPLFTWHTVFNIASLIVFQEALRVKCGTREGLLSLVFGPLLPTQRATDPAEALADRLAAATEAQSSKPEQLLSSDALPDGEALANTYQLAAGDLNTPVYADLVDPTMKLEGFSWLQDLTAPDSTMILPLALSAVMAANVFLRPRIKKDDDRVQEVQEKLKELDQSNESAQVKPAIKRASQPEVPKSTTVTNDVLHAMEVAEKLRLETQKTTAARNPLARLSNQKKISLVFTAMFFYVGQHLPAALVLYMVTSMATAWLQSRWLDVKYPRREPILPCRRPMRFKVKREFADT